MFENTCWFAEYCRETGDREFHLLHFITSYIFRHRFRYVVYLRKAQNARSKMTGLYYKFKLYRLSRKYGIEINAETKIGKGFLMIHPYNITISSLAELGDNVTMLKGATVGVSGGKRAGAHKIVNSVYIGINSTVCGGISIGDDVLIAPNTFVNEDVPSHSIVVGNPCKIIHKENATAPYIHNKV